MSDSLENCRALTVDFVIRDDDPEMAAVEDDIRRDLLKLNINVNTRVLNASEYGDAERNGDFNLLFTRTWGAPYDPHTYLNSWAIPAHVEYAASAQMEPPLTRDDFLAKVQNVQRETDPSKLQTQWTEILNDIHQQAIFLPLWGTRIPYVVSRRLTGFEPSPQAFSYPLETVRVLQGSPNVTIAPGAGGSLFESLGPMNPHQYFLNQLFAQKPGSTKVWYRTDKMVKSCPPFGDEVDDGRRWKARD